MTPKDSGRTVKNFCHVQRYDLINKISHLEAEAAFSIHGNKVVFKEYADK